MLLKTMNIESRDMGCVHRHLGDVFASGGQLGARGGGSGLCLDHETLYPLGEDDIEEELRNAPTVREEWLQ